MMMTVPELNILERDFLDQLPFAVGKTPELLQKGNWFIHFSRVLRKLLQDRNRQIEIALREALKGSYFNEIMSVIQIQDSIAVAECVTTLQLIEQTQMILQILERIGRTYKNAGKLSTVIPPEALSDAIKRLRAITSPFVAAMAGGPPSSGLNP